MTELEQQLRALKLPGLLAHFEEIRDEPWLPRILAWEQEERARRGLDA